MHIDAAAARRTLAGACVVHGVHLVCWALESWLAAAGGSVGSLERLTATFHRAVLVGEEVICNSLDDGDGFLLEIRRDGIKVASIRGRTGAPLAYAGRMAEGECSRDCRLMGFDELANASGNLPLSMDLDATARLFPLLSKALPSVQLAAILGTTRLVGMECPGLHSFYSTMKLDFSRQVCGRLRMDYRAIAVNRFGGVRLSISGPGFSGELGAFLRPPPATQSDMQALAPLVRGGEFAAQRGLVIGGSRGLGEVTAKLLALGGAHVTITYRLGKQDAAAVAAEIRAVGGACDVLPFDIHEPTAFQSDAPIDSLYYFATPHITFDKSVVFSQESFAEYCRYYVAGFARTALAIGNPATELNVFYPSTIFLDQASSGFAEYCAAKAAGEQLCRQLSDRFPHWRIYAPRLPRMATDQTSGMLPGEAASPETILLPHIRKMAERK